MTTYILEFIIVLEIIDKVIINMIILISVKDYFYC